MRDDRCDVMVEMARIGGPRVWVTSAFAAVLMAEAAVAGWTVRAQAPAAFFNVVASAASGCIPVILGMVLVRSVFKARLVRALFDVLAILIWVLMVAVIGDVFSLGAQVLTGEGVYLTPVASFGLSIGAVVVTSLVGVIAWLWSDFRKPQ